MRYVSVAISVASAICVLVVGLFAVPVVFAGRVLPGLRLNGLNLTGLPHANVPQALQAYNEELQQQIVSVSVRGTTVQAPLQDLGVSLDVPSTYAEIQNMTWPRVMAGGQYIAPRLNVDKLALASFTSERFSSLLRLPVNASLQVSSAGAVVVVPAAPGEGPDASALAHTLVRRVNAADWQRPIALEISAAAPAIADDDIAAVRDFAARLLADGLTLAFQDQTWEMKPVTLRRLLTFTERSDPAAAGRSTLQAALDSSGVAAYLSATIAPEINQAPANARFVRNGDRVEQFSMAREGRTINLNQSAAAINDALAQNTLSVPLVVDVEMPAVQEVSDTDNLGINRLVASAETNFVGSPANRRHNIVIGTNQFHGLLIAPGAEFSFDEHVGPVDGKHGFLPELVIKNHVTTPEFGGGLCQVSTTMFRAAVQAGFKITERRNHAYVVRYYGQPGFDATIYPPYTDLRFINNTPGYILIQARVEGTKDIFEFWGTDDGRHVEVAGPVSYDRQPNGSLKAKLTQQVTKDGVVIIDDTFLSRYQSPDLFPKVLAASVSGNDPATSNATNSPSPIPAASPAASSPAPRVSRPPVSR